MKINYLKIGGRTAKTVIAVFLCFFIDTIRKNGVPFYAAIAAILCIQPNYEDSLHTALNREIATIIGGIWGMLVLLIEKKFYCISYDILRYLFLSVMLILIINFSVWIRQEKGTFLMCVVFLCVTVTHCNDKSPFTFGFDRIIDTTIGIIVALLVNRFPALKRKQTNIHKPLPKNNHS